MQKEIWKDIPGYEGRYAVSSLGNVYSYRSRRNLKPGWMGDYSKYLGVSLYKDGKSKSKRVHRLVMEVFCPIDNMDEMTVNHINEDTSDNRLENLEWMTLEDNIVYSNGQPIGQYDLDGNLVHIYKSMRASSRAVNSDVTTILQHIRSGKPYKNFYWKKIDKSEIK